MSSGSPDKIPTQFKDSIWIKAGNLKQARTYHGAITVKEITTIVGGFGIGTTVLGQLSISRLT